MLDFHPSRALIVQPEHDLPEEDVPFMSARELDTLLAQSGHLAFITEAHAEALRKVHRIIRETIVQGATTERLFTKIENDARRYMTPMQYARFEALYLNAVREDAYAYIHRANQATFTKIGKHMEELPVGVAERTVADDDGFHDTFMFGWLKNRK